MQNLTPVIVIGRPLLKTVITSDVSPNQIAKANHENQ